jgi:hypothetical protein
MLRGEYEWSAHPQMGKRKADGALPNPKDGIKKGTPYTLGSNGQRGNMDEGRSRRELRKEKNPFSGIGSHCWGLLWVYRRRFRLFEFFSSFYPFFSL